MYLCDQLSELQIRLKSLNYSVENEIEIKEEFKSIIKKHIRLMGYANALARNLKEYFLIQNLAVTAELCLNALMASMSTGIALAAYESSWISWPLDMQKDLLLVITAAQRSFKLTAGGIAYMSMPTFAQALYNGYSVFAVLRDVIN
ncbi:unnamed protein product [Diatraea saccharalis]|uniref:Odorant receptor n=1 Tax=Diatraea saccharalis TaxID=40085 RepID=A0A9N9REP9_9NEOP|nr:unnamed protein product [Diatraea saccharalis]